MGNIETSGDWKAKIINMADHKNGTKFNKEILQRFYDKSNHLAENLSTDGSKAENSSTKKPTMKILYKNGEEVLDKTRLAAFVALSDHLD